MPLIARQRSRFAVLAVLALVGSLLAVSAVPAVAAGDEKPSQEAEASACVAAATGDAGFTDMDGSFAEDAANCLAHYGITKGTSDGVFSPNASITRLQMALFMVRAAGPAGIEMDDTEDQGFTDIGNMTDAIQDAINQATALKIMSGSDGMFNPTGMVSRQEMAAILDGFITAANGDDYYSVDDADEDTPFGDLGAVPFASYNSIIELYELGVAAGTGDGSTFSPATLVSRGQMAVFVTRALAHTNARPAGVSIQGAASGSTGGTPTLDVSVRDGNHQPVPDALVDVISSTNPDEAFGDEGGCVTKHVVDDRACTIDDDDPATDPEGNIGVDVTLPDDPGTLTVWAWSGDVNDEFDADETESASIEVDVSLEAVQTLVTDDMKEHAESLQFGDTVTYTLQLVDTNEDPVAEEGVEFEVTATIEDKTGKDGKKRADIQTTVKTYKTDAAGRIEVSYSADDPDSDNDNQDVIELRLEIMTDSGPTISDNKPETTWSDGDSKAKTLALDQAVEYHETDDDGVRNTVTATLVDQYGDPIKKKKVAFWSDAKLDNGDASDSPGLGGTKDKPADRRTSGGSGVATKSYSRSLLAGFAEKISASFVLENGECLDTDKDCTETDDKPIEAKNITHYWAVRIAPASNQKTDTVTGGVVVADTDNNTIVVVDDKGPKLATYKAGDHFQIVGAAVSLAAFEDALDDDEDRVEMKIGDDEDDINTFNISINKES